MADAAPHVVNLAEKLSLFSDHWNPRIVGRYNGNEVRISKLKGEFVWHSHAETDELFLVLKGRLNIEFRGGVRTLGPGEAALVLDDGSIVAMTDQSDGIGLVPPGRVLHLAGPIQPEFTDSGEAAHPED